MRGKFALNLCHVDKRPVPARFKLARHQPVRGVSGIVLPEGPVGGIARRPLCADRVEKLENRGAPKSRK